MGTNFPYIDSDKKEEAPIEAWRIDGVVEVCCLDQFGDDRGGVLYASAKQCSGAAHTSMGGGVMRENETNYEMKTKKGM